MWLSHPCLPGSLSVLPVCVRPPASLRTQSPSDPGGPSPALGPALDGGDWLTGLLRVCGPPLAAPSACGGRGDGELRMEVSLEETLQDLSTPVPRPGTDTGHTLLALPGATHTAVTGPACLPALLGRVPRGWGSHLAASCVISEQQLTEEWGVGHPKSISCGDHRWRNWGEDGQGWGDGAGRDIARRPTVSSKGPELQGRPGEVAAVPRDSG